MRVKEVAALRHYGAEDCEHYALGILPKRKMERLEEHLLICERCRNRVAEYDQYVAAMRRAALKVRKGK